MIDCTIDGCIASIPHHHPVTVFPGGRVETRPDQNVVYGPRPVGLPELAWHAMDLEELVPEGWTVP
jgi:hypothetical protein